MYGDQPESVPAPIIVAWLHGVSRRHARIWRDPTEAETAAAVAELRQVTGKREDGPALLAHVAGILEGVRPDEKLCQVAAYFCRQAGADEDSIGRWREIGRERGERARQPPFGARLL